MKLLIGYLILINLAGLFSMAFDKLRARRKKYRIPERFLLFIAAMGGSAGSLAGMYLFRHKTRHKRFSAGLPILLFLQIAIFLAISSSLHAEAGRPSAAVRRELNLVRDMDDDTIRSFIAYQALEGKRISESEEDAAFEAVRLFFDPFQYEILEEQIFGDRATVSVNISNLDTHALAHDLCFLLTSSWIDRLPQSDEENLFAGYFSLLRDTLKSHKYEKTEMPAVFHLTSKKHKWTIDSGDNIPDIIMGGFLSNLRDPYILSPEEVFSLYMEKLSALDTEGWIRYLKTDDLFATESEKYASEVDKTFFDALSGYFSWQIASCVTEGDNAEITVDIVSINMKKILDIYHEKLLSYAGTTDSITDDNSAISDMTAELLIDSIKEGAAPAQFTASVTLHNDGTGWKMDDILELIDAILGKIDSALEVMRS